MQECELSIDYLEMGRVVHRSQAIGFISDGWIYAKIGDRFVSVKKSDTLSQNDKKSMFEEATIRTMIVDSKIGLRDKRFHSFDTTLDNGDISKKIEDYISRRMKIMSYCV